jgi:hypothetical protein
MATLGAARGRLFTVTEDPRITQINADDASVPLRKPLITLINVRPTSIVRCLFPRRFGYVSDSVPIAQVGKNTVLPQCVGNMAGAPTRIGRRPRRLPSSRYPA